MTDAEEGGNIQQRLFDAFPGYPGIVTIDSLSASLPYPRRSILDALGRLRERGIVEPAPRTSCCVYRLRKGARRPVDMRGQHGNSGRRPRAD